MAQVQGEEIYLAHSGQEVDDNIDEVQAARGSEASLSARLADIVSDFETDQQRQETEIGAVAALGAKNLLKLNAASQTISGVTFTVNDDQTITVNGTASANSDFSINTALSLTAGSYILSGCPSGGSGTPTTYKLQIQSIGYDTGNGLAFNLSAARNANVYIRIWSGYTANNLVFKPMIRRAEITDDTFVPYAPSNRELYETKADKAEIHSLLSSIDSNTTITAYADSLARGHYTTFVSNASRPSDAPIADNMFIEIYVYSAATALIRTFPTGTAYSNQIFQISKVSGVWRGWYKFEGTPVASAQSAASLMQAGRLDTAELTDTETDESEEEER